MSTPADDVVALLADLDTVINVSTRLIADPSVSWTRKTTELQDLSKLVDLRRDLAIFDDARRSEREDFHAKTRATIDDMTRQHSSVGVGQSR